MTLPAALLSTDQPTTSGDDRSLGYRPALDGVRALAVALVVGYHLGIKHLPGGFVGVDLFFVLSGYLITALLLNEWDRRGRISFTNFYARRMRRLLPAMAAVALVVVLATLLYENPIRLQDRFHDLLGALFYYANWHFIWADESYFAGNAGVSPLRHTWSLSIEEQFYLVWPALLVVLLTVLRPRARRVVLPLVVVVGIALSALAMARLYTASAPSRAYYGSDARAHQLLVGVLLAVVVAQAHRLPRAAAAVVGAMGVVGVLVMAVTLHGTSSFYYRGGSLVFAVAGAALILGVEQAPRSALGRVLSVGPVVWLGRISYGVYLWHWPIIVWLQPPHAASRAQHAAVLVARVLLTLVVSAASFVLLERPIRSGAAPWVGRSATRALAAGAATLVLIAGVAYAATRPTAHQKVASVVAEHSVTACPHQPAPCLRHQGPPGAPVVATVGDSTMQMYDPGLRSLAATHGFTYVQAAIGGCPIERRFLATGGTTLHKSANYLCYDNILNTYRTLLRRYHPAVILATAYNEESQSVTGNGTLLRQATPQQEAAVKRGLEDAVRLLTANGATLVFIDILPRGPGASCLLESASGACRYPVSADNLPPIYNGIFRTVAQEFPARVKVVSLTDIVCPHGVCTVTVDGVVMRYDGGHFTKAASLIVAPVLYERLKAAGVSLP